MILARTAVHANHDPVSGATQGRLWIVDNSLHAAPCEPLPALPVAEGEEEQKSPLPVTLSSGKSGAGYRGYLSSRF